MAPGQMLHQGADAENDQEKQQQGAQGIAYVAFHGRQLLPPAQRPLRREDRLLGNKGRILEAELVASLSGKADGGADHLANSIQLGLGPAAFGSHGVVDQYRKDRKSVV